MQTALTLETLASLLLAVGLGAVIGIQREKAHRPAGLRTHMLVSLGSCLFTVVSMSFSSQPAQVAAGIVAGIRFIGAGTIWVEKDVFKGVTTAASLWSTAAMGLTAGLGDYLLAIPATFLIVVILSSRIILEKVGLQKPG